MEEETCILILYEKLPNFCNACGRFGHLTKDCENKLVEKTALKYDCWIRAPAVPAGRISGNLRNRLLKFSDPVDQGGEFESPTQSNPKNMTLSMENIRSNSDDLDPGCIGRASLNQGKILWMYYQHPLLFFRIIRTLWIRGG